MAIAHFHHYRLPGRVPRHRVVRYLMSATCTWFGNRPISVTTRFWIWASVAAPLEPRRAPSRAASTTVGVEGVAHFYYPDEQEQEHGIVRASSTKLRPLSPRAPRAPRPLVYCHLRCPRTLGIQESSIPRGACRHNAKAHHLQPPCGEPQAPL